MKNAFGISFGKLYPSWDGVSRLEERENVTKCYANQRKTTKDR
jgi:hypothetical protein